MRPPKLRPSQSIGRRVMAFRIFSNNDRPPFWILKILIFDHVTVIAVRICCCIPNFNKTGSRVQPPNAHNCWMYNAPLLGNGRYHGNRITADMSRTWWDVTTQVASQSVYWHASYGISNIFQQRPSAILNFKNFNIWSRDCHCGPNLLWRTKFHQNWFARSASRRP